MRYKSIHAVSHQPIILRLLVVILLVQLLSSCRNNNNNNNNIGILFVNGWHTCDDVETTICPNGNKCCYYNNNDSAKCISGKNSSLGECCNDDNDKWKTGCGDGFRCSYRNDNKVCERIDPNDDKLPSFIPRYKLCSVTKQSLQQVHGLTVMNNNNRTKNNKFIAAYLSTHGAIEDIINTNNNSSSFLDTVFIVIHGSGRNPDDYLCCSYTALEIANRSNTTLLIAPWFASPKDKVNITRDTSNINQSNTTTTILRWIDVGGNTIDHTWRYGANAINSNISSYEILDVLIEHVLHHIPTIRNVIIAGHSAGGQYVQRWSLLSDIPTTINDNNDNIHIRIVVANPKSYCYLDNRRWFNGTLRIPNNDAIYICPSYNEWEWGLNNSTKTSERDSLVCTYKDYAIIRNPDGINGIINRYQYRNIIYLSGELDILWNGDCEAKIQGENRLIRSKHFYLSLQNIYNKNNNELIHEHIIVKNVHHDHCLMFQSKEGQYALFGSNINDNNNNQTNNKKFNNTIIM